MAGVAVSTPPAQRTARCSDTADHPGLECQLRRLSLPLSRQLPLSWMRKVDPPQPRCCACCVAHCVQLLRPNTHLMPVTVAVAAQAAVLSVERAHRLRLRVLLQQLQQALLALALRTIMMAAAASVSTARLTCQSRPGLAAATLMQMQTVAAVLMAMMMAMMPTG